MSKLAGAVARIILFESEKNPNIIPSIIHSLNISLKTQDNLARILTLLPEDFKVLDLPFVTQ